MRTVSPFVKPILSAGASLPSTGPTCPATVTSEPLSPSQQTLFAEASPAKTSASQESPQGGSGSGETAAAYGRRCLGLLASYDRPTRSWRTSQRCFLETLADGLAEFLETWPRSGTTRNGIAYQLPPLAPLTDGTESGLLPTPTAREWKDRGRPCVLQKLARGDGVAKEIFKLSRTHRMSREITAGLNPSFAQWMMGYPSGWTDFAPLAIQSSRKSPKSSGGQS
jgi:hypothetical protein